MKTADVERYKDWFKGYIKQFFGTDTRINANLKLKQKHTYCVCNMTNYLTIAMGSSENDRLIAYAVGLFHDVGRFEQFAKFGTFADGKSFNHALKAVEILEQNSVLDDLPIREKELIFAAIKCHNVKHLPDGLDPDSEFFAKIIRDADKLDIYRIAIQNFKEYADCPEGLVQEVIQPESEEISEHVIEALEKGQMVEYSSLRSLNDVKLLQLGWVYDINFGQSLRKIKKLRYLEEIIKLLPGEPRLSRAIEKVLEYRNANISD